MRDLVRRSASEVEEEHKFGLHFLFTEWSRVVDAWQLASWAEYRDVPRLGRKTRLSERQRSVLWSIFSNVSDALDERGLLTEPRLFGRLEQRLAKLTHPPFEFLRRRRGPGHRCGRTAVSGCSGRRSAGRAVLRRRPRPEDLPDAVLLASTGGRHQGPFTDFEGQLPNLPPDPPAGGPTPAERNLRRGRQHRSAKRHVSVFNGSEPVIRMLGSPDEECAVIAQWLDARKQERDSTPRDRVIREITSRSGASHSGRKEGRFYHGRSGQACRWGLRIGSQSAPCHLAKGMEFRAVAVVACDDEVLPLQSRIESVGDEADLEEVYTSERHLLYVACTRARDHLLVTAVSPASEFLDDLRSPG